MKLQPPLAPPGTIPVRLFIPAPAVRWDQMLISDTTPVLPVPPEPKPSPAPPTTTPVPEYVNQIRQMFRAGVHLRAIAHELNRLGYGTPIPGINHWLPLAVKRVLMAHPAVRKPRGHWP